MKSLSAIALTLLLATASAVHALPHELDRLRLKDQHETPVKIPTDTRFLVFAHDMSGKDIVTEWLESKEEGYMNTNRVVYVVNISGMPRIIARMFAMPALRKKPYQIIIDEVGQKTEDWESSDDKVSVFTVDDLTVTNKQFAASVSELDALIIPAPVESEEQVLSEDAGAVTPASE